MEVGRIAFGPVGSGAPLLDLALVVKPSPAPAMVEAMEFLDLLRRHFGHPLEVSLEYKYTERPGINWKGAEWCACVESERLGTHGNGPTPEAAIVDLKARLVSYGKLDPDSRGPFGD